MSFLQQKIYRQQQFQAALTNPKSFLVPPSHEKGIKITKELVGHWSIDNKRGKRLNGESYRAPRGPGLPFCRCRRFIPKRSCCLLEKVRTGSARGVVRNSVALILSFSSGSQTCASRQSGDRYRRDPVLVFLWGASAKRRARHAGAIQKPKHLAIKRSFRGRAMTFISHLLFLANFGRTGESRNDYCFGALEARNLAFQLFFMLMKVIGCNVCSHAM